MAGRRKKSSPLPGNETDSKISDQVTVTTASEEQNQKTVSITLDPVITLAEVNSLRETFLGYINAGQIQIDVSKVEHIDTAGLQLLLAFSKAHGQKGGNILWLGKSMAYSGTAGLLGLTAALGLEA